MKSKDLVSLMSIPGIGANRAKLLISHFETVDNILKANYRSLCQVESIDKKLATAILKYDSGFADRQLESIEKNHAKVVTFWDEEYPQSLKNLFDPPLLLFYLGDLKILEYPSIAIVGTRRCSEYGRKMAYDLSIALSNNGINVISGLARGIDTHAHHGALKGKGKTVAILGSGLDVIYPPENLNLARDIEANGLVVSEYLMGTEPLAGNFPKRNRIISGLSLGTVVIEANIKSGAMITAMTALEQGREVMAVPGKANTFYSKGPHKLLREGAALIETVDDIYQAVPVLSQPEEEYENLSMQLSLDPVEEEILSHLSDEPLHVDKLAENMMKSTSEILTLMLNLELNNQVKQLSGMRFIRQ